MNATSLRKPMHTLSTRCKQAIVGNNYLHFHNAVYFISGLHDHITFVLYALLAFVRAVFVLDLLVSSFEHDANEQEVVTCDAHNLFGRIRSIPSNIMYLWLGAA